MRGPRAMRLFDGLPILLGLALCAGCDDEPGPVACGFEGSHLVARAAGAGFDGLALVPSGDDGARVVWADRDGLHALDLAADGSARGASRRVGAGCAGGLAALGDGDTTTVACARPADADRGRDGELTLVSIGADRSETQGRTGPVSPESRGVAIAAHGGRVFVGWRDSTAFAATARMATFSGGSFEAPEPLSSVGPLASAPALDVVEGRLVAAWTESWLTPSGAPAGHLFVRSGGEPARPSLDVGDIDVRVRLTHDGRGPLVSLRDSRPRGARHRLFVGRPDARAMLDLDDVRSPGRADDDDAHPHVVACGDHLFAVATRRSSREVTMVTVERLDPATLRSAEPEHQIYEYHARFPWAEAACVGDRLLIVVGERATRVSPSPRLRTYVLRCAPGVEHQRTPTIDGREHD